MEEKEGKKEKGSEKKEGEGRK